MWRGITQWRSRRRPRVIAKPESLPSLSRRQRMLRVALIAAGAVVICGYLDELTGEFDDLEQQAYSERLKIDAQRKGFPKDESAKIVLVTISDDTLKDLHVAGSRVPRDYHARVIQNLTRAGAKVIAFDVFFKPPLPSDPDQGQKIPQLAAAAKASGRVVWGCRFEKETQKVLLPDARLLQACPHWGHSDAQWSYTREPPTAEVSQEADNTQESSTAVDSIQPFLAVRQAATPALSVEVVRLYLGLNQPPQRTSSGWQIGDLNIPTEKHGASSAANGTEAEDNGILRIHFLDPDRKPFQKWTYQSIYRTKELPRDIFQDRIVLIGDTRIKTTLHPDYHWTPVGTLSGVEIQAHAIATLLTHQFVREVPSWVNLALLSTLAALVGPLAAVRHLRQAALAMGVLLVGYFLLNIWLFVDYGIFLHLVAPSATIGMTTIGVLIERGFAQEHERTRVRAILEHVLGPEVSKDGVPQGIITLAFTDLEGSSELSQQHGAAFEVVRDEHFRLLRESAKVWQGFEVETAGDSLFVVFANAAHAVQFAVDAQLSLARQQWPAEIGHIRVRIGMHTGEPFVGQDRRRLTFRGPVTNRAARVMGAGHGGQILVSKTTYEAAQPAVPTSISFLDFQIHRLKGVGEENLFQVCHSELPCEFPALNTLGH